MRPKSFIVKPVILTYNNSTILELTLARLQSWGFKSADITIIENGSSSSHKKAVSQIAKGGNYLLVDYETNRGWGGAINYYLETHCRYVHEDHILLIMAHDCYFQFLCLDEIIRYFNDPNAIFVCPAYPTPLSSYYNIFRSFYSKPVRSHGKIAIGHQTAFFTRASHLIKVLYNYSKI